MSNNATHRIQLSWERYYFCGANFEIWILVLCLCRTLKFSPDIIEVALFNQYKNKDLNFDGVNGEMFQNITVHGTYEYNELLSQYDFSLVTSVEEYNGNRLELPNKDKIVSFLEDHWRSCVVTVIYNDEVVARGFQVGNGFIATVSHSIWNDEVHANGFKQPPI